MLGTFKDKQDIITVKTKILYRGTKCFFTVIAVPSKFVIKVFRFFWVCSGLNAKLWKEELWFPFYPNALLGNQIALSRQFALLFQHKPILL